MKKYYQIKTVITFSYKENNKKQSNIRDVIGLAFRVNYVLKREINNLYQEYAKEKEIFYNKVNYYKRYGGVYPSSDYKESLDFIDRLKEMKEDILDRVDEMKEENFYYWDFYLYLRDILRVLD